MTGSLLTAHDPNVLLEDGRAEGLPEQPRAQRDRQSPARNIASPTPTPRPGRRWPSRQPHHAARIAQQRPSPPSPRATPAAKLEATLASNGAKLRHAQLPPRDPEPPARQVHRVSGRAGPDRGRTRRPLRRLAPRRGRGGSRCRVRVAAEVAEAAEAASICHQARSGTGRRLPGQRRAARTAVAGRALRRGRAATQRSDVRRLRR